VTHRRAPRPVARAVEELASAVAPRSLLGDVQRVWESAVGPAVAREASPQSERDGTITIACSSTVWAQELELLAPELISQLNTCLGVAAVTGLRCRLARA
jgi:predicted nucleic acid-binding Zn ribbon protein